MTFYAYVLLGLATSLHCVAMCGGLVLTYTAAAGDSAGPWARISPHLAYQSAKIASYALVAVVLGALAGTVGAVLDVAAVRTWIMLVAGAYMVLLGLSMTGWFPWLARIAPRAPRFLMDALSRNRGRARADSAKGRSSLTGPVVLGLLTGLMPCAPLIAAQAGAMSAGSPVGGAVLMVGFGLGTAPLMLAFGLASGFLTAAVRHKMQYVAAIAVVVFGLVLVDRGLMLVGSPVTFSGAVASLSRTAPADAVPWRVVGGVAEFDLVIRDTRFVPDEVRLPAGMPARLVVDRQEASSCSAQLAVPQMGVLADLAPNAKTTVEIPAASAGVYTLTCGMGMMSGSIVVGDASGSGAAWPLAAAAAAAVGAAAWILARRRRRSGLKASKKDRPRAVLLGLTREEVIVAGVAAAVAIAAGLYAGGFAR